MSSVPQTSSDPAFDQSIAVLQSAMSLIDPDALVQVLKQHPQATAIQLKKLWEVAVTQSVVAEVQIASGDQSSRTQQWRDIWIAGAESLRDTLLPLLGAEGEQMLATYWQECRTAKAFPQFASLVRDLESALDRQRSFIGFHWDEKENSYRQQEAELAGRISADSSSDTGRIDTAKAIISAVDQYKATLTPKLDRVTSEIDRAISRCAPFVPMFSTEQHPEVARWFELTQQLTTARKAAVANVLQNLEWDRVLPDAVIAGDIRMALADGKTQLVLNEQATARVKEFAERAAQLIEQSSGVEQGLREERESLVRHLLGEPVSDEVAQAPLSERTPTIKRHPLETRAWFRFAKICWWAAAIVALLFSMLVGAVAGTSAFVISAVALGAILIGIRMLVLYVVLGRPTLYERRGSGFIDVDMLEQEVVDADAEFLSELRKRYGRRAPEAVVRAFIDRNLANTRAEKQRILAAADREGKAISIEALRKSMRDSVAALPADQQDASINAMELLLLRLEVKYGSEIPVLAANELADQLSAEPA